MSESELLQIVVDKLGAVGEELAELRSDFRFFSDLMGRVLGGQRFDLEAIADDLAKMRRCVSQIARAQNPGDGLTDSSL